CPLRRALRKGGQMEDMRMSVREHHRYELVRGLLSGKSRERLVAEQLDLSCRQVRRLKCRVRADGPKGVVHAGRGRPSNRRTPEAIREKVKRLYVDRYEGFNLSHYVEKLAEKEGVRIGLETVREMLLAAGLWQKCRKHPKHRLRRPRREREGELLQVDASIHAWLAFSGDEKKYALIGAIDDATGRAWARFELAETTDGYFRMMEGVLRQGVPSALYSDKDTVFTMNAYQQQAAMHRRGAPAQTQFERAMRELGVKGILANSPQAKGRIERLWKTFQDRLYNELRLEGVKTLPEANRYLHRVFLPDFNRRFTRPPVQPETAFKPTPLNWRRILCAREGRTLANDHTFQMDAQVFQVLPHPEIHALRGKRVEVCRSLRGGVEVYHKVHRLKIRPVSKSRSRIFPIPPRGDRKGNQERTFLLRLK
ncbi:MAG: ISNCY family transposase, partial [Dehalococcoidia bacterium]|nr:ISNCY family transposase [Dehalococcoidia bacterium]